MCSQSLHIHLYTCIIIFDNVTYLSSKVFSSYHIHWHSLAAAICYPSFLLLHFRSFTLTSFSVKFQGTCKTLSFIMEFSYVCGIIDFVGGFSSPSTLYFFIPFLSQNSSPYVFMSHVFLSPSLCPFPKIPLSSLTWSCKFHDLCHILFWKCNSSLPFSVVLSFPSVSNMAVVRVWRTRGKLTQLDEAGVTDRSQQSTLGLGIKIWSSARAVGALHLGAPALPPSFQCLCNVSML